MGMIDIDYLLYLNINQHGCLSEGGTRQDMACVGRLDGPHASRRQGPGSVVAHAAIYIVSTPLEMRCPCARGVVRKTNEVHFRECDPVHALELKAKHLAEVAR